MSGNSLLIVIPCLDEERHLGTLLEHMLADNPQATIVVADGGSRDSSRQIVERLQASSARLHLFDNPARLQSVGINLALERFGSGKKWLLRVDAHCSYPRGYAEGLCRVAVERNATCVVVPMVTRGEGCFGRAAAAAQNSWLGTGGSAHRHLGSGRFVEHGHHALMSIGAFKAAGGYREDMPAHEDAEQDARLIARGARIWLEPDLVIGYVPRSTLTALWRQYFRYGQGRARTLLLHRLRPRLRQLLPLAPAVALLSSPLACWWLPAIFPLLAWAAAVILAGAALGAALRTWCATLSGFAAGTMHLAWGSGFLLALLVRTSAKL